MDEQERATVVAGVVIAGGQGERLGEGPAKALRPVGTSTLGARATRVLMRVLGGGPTLYSTDPDIELPVGVPTGVEVIDDPFPDQGPLAGITASLEALVGRADRLVVVPCDMPLLHPAVLRRLMSVEVSDRVIAIGRPDGPPGPFPSVWPISLTAQALAIFSAGERSPAKAMQEIGMEILPRELLLEDVETTLSDPDLIGLEDIDDADDLGSLRRSAPRVRLLLEGRRSATTAWDLGSIAETLSLSNPSDAGWVVNGRPVGWDPELPLVERDAVSIL